MVEFEVVKSAEPPMSSGISFAKVLITLLEALRVGIPLASASKKGRLSSQPAGNSPLRMRFNSDAS